MKNLTRILSVLGLTIMAVNVFAGEEARFDVAPEKIYLDSSKIHIEGKDIFVYLNESWTKATALHTDTNGIYVMMVDSWKCRDGHPNPPWATRCWTCGKAQGE